MPCLKYPNPPHTTPCRWGGGHGTGGQAEDIRSKDTWIYNSMDILYIFAHLLSKSSALESVTMEGNAKIQNALTGECMGARTYKG
jgi:hypothetical protein